MSTLELKNISKIYIDDIKVVNNVNIQAGEGEFVVFVGPSGCGKTTILRMIAGLENITEGELYIDGKLMNDIPPKDRDIAMVFQNYALYPHMSVYENMSFGLKLRKVDKQIIREKVMNAAKILGLTEYLNRKPKELSGGQRQRVALGRAIVREPKIFLFDEPLSNLDAKLRNQMRTELANLHNKLNATMIYVTHDQIEAMTLGDKIIVLNNGEVQQSGTPADLYLRPSNKFVAEFIGSPQMNFLDGTTEVNEGLSFIDSAKSIRINLDENTFENPDKYINKKVILGFRPEAIELNTNGASYPAVVKLVEFLGSETIVHLDTGNQTLVAKVNRVTQLKPGDKIKFNIDNGKLHFFDADTFFRIN